MQCYPSRHNMISISQEEYDRLREAEIRLRAMEPLREWNPVRTIEERSTVQANRSAPSTIPDRPTRPSRSVSQPPNWDRQLARQQELLNRRELLAQGIDPDRRPACTRTRSSCPPRSSSTR